MSQLHAENGLQRVLLPGALCVTEVCRTTASVEREGLRADPLRCVPIAARDPVIEAGSAHPQNAVFPALSPPLSLLIFAPV